MNNMNMNMNMNIEKWAVFASYWKSKKLLLMLLTMFCWTEVLSKKVWEALWANPCLPRQFLACVILECFVKFLDDPYYEPLLWFMIIIIWQYFVVDLMFVTPLIYILWRIQHHHPLQNRSLIILNLYNLYPRISIAT